MLVDIRNKGKLVEYSSVYASLTNGSIYEIDFTKIAKTFDIE
jgi:hypothetical protein